MYKGKRLLYTGKALQSQDNNHMYRMYRIILIKFLKNNIYQLYCNILPFYVYLA